MCGVRQVTGREVERTLKKLCMWGGRDRERGERKNPATETEEERMGRTNGAARLRLTSGLPDMWGQRGQGRVGRTGRVALTYIHCHL